MPLLPNQVVLMIIRKTRLRPLKRLSRENVSHSLGLISVFSICFLLSVSCKKETTTTTTSVETAGGSASSASTIRWSTQLDTGAMPIEIGSTFSNDEKQAIEDMADSWDAQSTIPFFRYEDVSNLDYPSLETYEDNRFGVYLSSGWFPNEVSSSALAITQYFVRQTTGFDSQSFYELLEADIIVNGSDHQFTTDASDTSASTYDFHSVIIHEFGHFLGIGHSPTGTNSVMKSTLNSIEVRRTLQAYDISTFTDRYEVETQRMNALEIEERIQNLEALGAYQGVGSTGRSVHNRPKVQGPKLRGRIELRTNGDCHHSLTTPEGIVLEDFTHHVHLK